VKQGETRKRYGICRALGHKRNSYPQEPLTEQQPTPSTTQQGSTTVEHAEGTQPSQQSE